MDAASPRKSQGPHPCAVASETPEPASHSTTHSLYDPSEFITIPEPSLFLCKSQVNIHSLTFLGSHEMRHVQQCDVWHIGGRISINMGIISPLLFK